jgi:cytoskeletal protein RodZ
MFNGFKLSRIALAVAVFALLASLAPSAFAQDAKTATQPQTQTPQTQTQPQQTTTPAATTTQTTNAQTDVSAKTGAQVASTPAGETVAAKAAAEPLYREYRGVTLGMSAADVRAKLGKPQEKSDVMDFYVFNDRERARVYYKDGKASAVIATYVGKDAGAPAPAAVLGADIEAKPDGSMYQMTPYKQAGYWVAYSRTPGDSPLVIITMQKTP